MGEMGDVNQGREWEPALCPIPSKQWEDHLSCITFMRSQDESDYPQANQFFMERSHLPQADPTARPTTTERGEAKEGFNNSQLQLLSTKFPFKIIKLR